MLWRSKRTRSLPEQPKQGERVREGSQSFKKKKKKTQKHKNTKTQKHKNTKTKKKKKKQTNDD